MLLSLHCFCCSHSLRGCVWLLFGKAILKPFSSFAIILLRERERERKRERERELFYFYCVIAIVWMLMFFVSFSRTDALGKTVVCDCGIS